MRPRGDGSRRGARAVPHGARERGLGVIEVLVALVVVSLGVLGVAGLQMTGMQHGSGSLHRTVALALAEDLAERMRTVAAGAVGLPSGPGTYDDFDSATLGAGFCDAPPVPYCDVRRGTPAQACDVAELVAFDRAVIACGASRWEAGTDGTGVLGGALPAGTIAVACEAPCTPRSVRTITVGWTEGEVVAPGAGTDRRVTMRLRP